MRNNPAYRLIAFHILLAVGGWRLAVSGLHGDFWEVKTFDDFLKCELENVSITSAGIVKIAPSLKRVFDTKELFVWSLAIDEKGNLYCGTGDEGKIFKITKDGKSTLFFDSPETQILALIFDKKGNLFCGTAPKGIIYRISTKGISEEYFDTEEKYVFALTFDKTGNLFAGTGDRGNIYKITGKNKGTRIYDASESHILSLRFRSDTLYASGAGKGILYRITELAKGKPEVMSIYDVPVDEIRDFNFALGNIYIIANPDYLTAAPEKSTQSAEKPSPLILKITPFGTVLQEWKIKDSLVFFISSGLIGTGNKGRLYSLQNDSLTLLTNLKEPQIISLAPAEPKVAWHYFLGTGNPGRVYLLSSNYSSQGRLTSFIYDTKSISDWGRLEHETEILTETDIKFLTRSGNSEEPDETWSPFIPVADGYIKSPRARFIQWQAVLSSDGSKTPLLKVVRVFFKPTNLPPVLTNLTVTPLPEKGKFEIAYKAVDPRTDSLLFSIYYRGVDEKNWKLLKEDIATPSYILDSEFLPDGLYEIKVLATDKLDNPLGLELNSEKISDQFIIDNTPPRIQNISAKKITKTRYQIEFRVVDELSVITNCLYSINVSTPRSLAPSDKIFDSKEETFRFELELPKGENTIVFRATDNLKNIGTGKILIVSSEE